MAKVIHSFENGEDEDEFDWGLVKRLRLGIEKD